ncbi:hypothetical protein MCEMSEM18_03568 [Comamonadaceae bacterium]
MSAIKTITNWKIVPSSEDTVSLVGDVNGQVTQTSPVRFARKGEVKTENSIYRLGDKLPGVWEIQLEMKRPAQVNNLRRHGVL